VRGENRKEEAHSLLLSSSPSSHRSTQPQCTTSFPVSWSFFSLHCRYSTQCLSVLVSKGVGAGAKSNDSEKQGILPFLLIHVLLEVGRGEAGKVWGGGGGVKQFPTVAKEHGRLYLLFFHEVDSHFYSL
jgi:hypothetical protein